MGADIAAVEAKVANGTLTQDQADLMIQNMTERTEQAVNRTTVGPAEWSRGGGRMYGSGKMYGGGAWGGSANRWGGQDNTDTGSRFGSGMGRMGRTSY